VRASVVYTDVDNISVDISPSPERVRVTVVGAGLMGSQIACEYLLAGDDVTILARDERRARARLEDALLVAQDAGAIPAGLHGEARYTREPGDADLIVESLPEDLDLKIAALGPVLAAAPRATIASNTSSLSVAVLGAALGAADRVLGTHYWNPPLLMPLVEVVVPDRTDPARASWIEARLEAMGKRPKRVRDVPGFVWNRLQFALLREALWLAEQGVASPLDIDEIVRDGLARRWTLTGPFQTLALGGSATFEAVASNLFPELSRAETPGALAPYDRLASAEKDALRVLRDRGLAELLDQR
jgi:3-hydroxybutyryl-CoA dehydrogenase